MHHPYPTAEISNGAFSAPTESQSLGNFRFGEARSLFEGIADPADYPSIQPIVGTARSEHWRKLNIIQLLTKKLWMPREDYNFSSQQVQTSAKS